jgi:hypothetical protein
MNTKVTSTNVHNKIDKPNYELSSSRMAAMCHWQLLNPGGPDIILVECGTEVLNDDSLSLINIYILCVSFFVF